MGARVIAKRYLKTAAPQVVKLFTGSSSNDAKQQMKNTLSVSDCPLDFLTLFKSNVEPLIIQKFAKLNHFLDFLENLA